MNTFNPKTVAFHDHDHDPITKGFPWAMERLTSDRGWVMTAKYPGLDDDLLDRHAETIGGRMRLVRRSSGAVKLEWLDGVRVTAEGQAAE